MNTRVEDVLDKIVDNLNQLVRAETEAAVKSLQATIEDAIAEAGKDLKAMCSRHYVSCEEQDRNKGEKP